MFSGDFNQNADGQPLESMPPVRQFQEITREAPDYIVAQLVGRDRVHEFGATSIEALRVYRLGGDRFDRTCFAITEGDTVHSAIYVSKSYGPVRSDRDLHGNVSDILIREASENPKTPDALIFYSISNITNVPSLGQSLVSQLHAHLGQAYTNARASTLSPLRSFDQNFTEEDRGNFLSLPAPEQKKLVLNYLLTGNDLVQQFHMGNGARIADIKLLPGDKSLHPQTGAVINHVAMINYAYDIGAEELRANAVAFRSVKQALRSKDADPAEARETVVRGIFARVSKALREETGWTASDLAYAAGGPALRF